MSYPGTKPARRVHVPPPPSGVLPDPGGRSEAERAHRRLVQTAEAYDRYRASIPEGVDPDELKDAAGQFAYSDQALALREVLKPVQDEVNAANQKVADAVKSLTVPDDKHDAARRIWERTKPQLDAATGIPAKVAVAQAVIAGAQGLELATLQEELPAYFRTQKLPGDQPVPMDWLTPALADRIPGLDEVRAESALKAKQLAVLAQNHAALTRTIANDNPPPPIYSPYSPAITAEPYRNGEPTDPRKAN